MSRIGYSWICIALCSGIAFRSVAQTSGPTDLIADGAAVGEGAWKSSKSSPVQRWVVDVKRHDDGSLMGTVAIENSPLLSTGTLKGKLDGETLSGTVDDQSGAQALTFTGRMTDTGGCRGTYEDRTGEVGQWQWDGPFN